MPAAGPSGASRWRQTLERRRDVVAVIAVAALVIAVTVASTVAFSARAASPDLLPGRPWWEGWVNWDSGYYRGIALFGYHYTPGHQGPVAFFPLYPLLMRAGSWLVGNVTGPGVLVTLGSGVGASVLLSRWFRARLAADAAWTALMAFLVFPYSFFLFGPVYADALFLLAVIGSFTALEHDRPLLAGLIGALATAARPLGAVLVVGLVIRTLERRGALGQSGPVGSRIGRLRIGDGGALVAVVGVGAYAAYLWERFGDPLAFLTIQKAWGQEEGPATWLKVDFFRQLGRFASADAILVLVAHAVVTVAAIALLPRVVRRFGWGYGLYAILIVGLPALSTKNFFGMGRYLLAAFPCFAVAGELLVDKGRLRTWVLTASGVAMVVMTSLFARAYYVS